MTNYEDTQFTIDLIAGMSNSCQEYDYVGTFGVEESLLITEVLKKSTDHGENYGYKMGD